MDALRGAGLEDVVYGAVDSGRPFLGICVGMQMLFTSSQEDLDARGLDIISGTVKWIPPGVKRPQMQWNKLSFTQPDDPMFNGELLRDAPDGSWVYFVHSLHGVPMDPSLVAATCDYGVTLNAAFRQDNVFATQFHPEKSGASGLALLDNFVKAAGAS
jgi:glutamine amidotransferase